MRIGFEEFDEADWTGVIFDEAQFVKNHNSKGTSVLDGCGPISNSPSPAPRWRTT